MTLDTHPYRKAMYAYAKEHALPIEKGFETAPHGLLGKPGRRFLGRIGNHMVATHKLAEKYNDGTLNTHMQHVLIPPLTFGEQVAHVLLAEVGTHEVPWGSNTGPDIRVYQSSTGGYYEPWCASFRSWGLQQCGYKGRVSARAWDFDDIGIHIGDAHHITKAEVGDAVTFNIGAGHIGTYLSHTSSMVKTVDGNTSDQVAVRERPLSVIRAITRQGK